MDADTCLTEIKKGVDVLMLDTLITGIARSVKAGNSTGLRNYCRDLADSAPKDPSDVKRLNVLAAGLLGVVPGGTGLEPEKEGIHPRVNGFLHELRWAMLHCPELDPLREDRARKFIFYPEYFADGRGLRDRIVDLANGHAGFGPIAQKGVTELQVLLSLGGFFSFSKNDKAGLRLAGSVGGIKTTCCMTARAIYHGAGAKMIGAAAPTLNTEAGMDINLGVPSRLEHKIDEEKRKSKLIAEYDVKRNPFTDDKSPNPPPLAAGDIYYLKGHGERKFMSASALAEHVGVVVGVISRTEIVTVDGGGGSAQVNKKLYGAEVTRGPKTMTLDGGEGWRFASGQVKTYTLPDAQKVKAGDTSVRFGHETIQGFWKPEQFTPPLVRADSPQIKTLLGTSAGAAP